MKPSHLNRCEPHLSPSPHKGFNCSDPNFNDKITDLRTGQRLAEFQPLLIASDSGQQEKFWLKLMEDTWFASRYYYLHSAEASGAAHAIGRVTCPVHGQDARGTNVTARAGHWDSDRVRMRGEAALRRTFRQVKRRLGRTQCDRGTAEAACDAARGSGDARCGARCPGPLRAAREAAAGAGGFRIADTLVREDETDLNVECGLCGMPLTSFANETAPGAVRVAAANASAAPCVATTDRGECLPPFRSVHFGGADAHREGQEIAFMLVHDCGGPVTHRVPFNAWQPCKERRWLSLPLEMLSLAAVPLPTSPALQRFLRRLRDAPQRVGLLQGGLRQPGRGQPPVRRRGAAGVRVPWRCGGAPGSVPERWGSGVGIRV